VLRFILRLALWPLILTGRLLRRLLAKPAVRSFLIWCTAGGALLGAEWLGARLLLGAHHSALLAFTAALANCLTLWLLLSLLRIGRARRRLRVERFESLLALSPPRFEEYVGELLRSAGYRDVRQVGGAGDLGADLICRDRKGRSVAVQCKRYAPGVRVGSREVQTFIGMMHVHHQAERGIFVTTSTLTAPAARLAAEHKLEVIDGPALARLTAP